MGFLDKAKKLAEQAQTKLDEVQTQFNEKQGTQSAGPPVDYDKHGRPLPATPGEAPTPPHGDPLGEATPPAAAPTAPTPDASAPPAPAAPPAPQGDPLGEAAPAPPAAVAPGAPQAAEDPNAPSYEPPTLSSGDPLAG
jgi:hypothetical protein